MVADSDKIVKIRDDAEAEFGPRGQRALSAWPVHLSEAKIANVACQIVEPATGENGGTILYFFGGGYVSGCPEHDLPITAALASLTGAQVVVPRYGLAPEHPFPFAPTQCYEVYRDLSAKGPLSVCGESAGGGLALTVVQSAIQSGLLPPKSMALFSPWGDLTEHGTSLAEEIDDPSLTADDLRFYAKMYLNGEKAHEPRASPALAPLPEKWPVTLLTTGSRDALNISVYALADRIKAAGSSCRVIEKPGMCHVFEVYDENPEARESLKEVARFVREFFTHT